MNVAADVLVLTLAAGLMACSREAPVHSYDFVVRVEADPNKPLAGAKLLHTGQVLGVTAADGRVAVRATGNEGERVVVEVSCPSGFRSPDAPLTITLRRGTSRPEYFAACPPLARKLVIAARFENGAGLPIRYLGRELARSDASGGAHLLVEAESDKTVELTIDTSLQPQLRPKSPTARFRVGSTDDIVVLEQAFQSSVKRVQGVQRASGPVRIR